MTRRGFVVAAVTAVVAAAAIGVAFVIGPWHELPPGPLGVETGVPNQISFDVDAGRSFTYGLVVLENRSERSAEVTGVELVGTIGSLELVSSSIRGLRDAPDHGLIANDRSFPPSALGGVLRPAIGSLIEPYRAPPDGVELVLELRANDPGGHGFAAVAVDYRQGNRAFRVVFPSSLRVCVGPENGCAAGSIGEEANEPGVY